MGFKLVAVFLAALAAFTEAQVALPLAFNQCLPAPLNGILGPNPCSCDCPQGHKAMAGVCNPNGQCICYYEGETLPSAPVFPTLSSCPIPIQQCNSRGNVLAEAGFIVGCNLDCICTHGAPAGGVCNFDEKACYCNYDGVNKNTASNANCPDQFKTQVGGFFTTFLTKATACGQSANINSTACLELTSYPVLLPALEFTRDIDGGNLQIFHPENVAAVIMKALAIPGF